MPSASLCSFPQSSCLSVCPVCVSCVYVCLSVCLPVYLSVCLPACLSIYLSGFSLLVGPCFSFFACLLLVLARFFLYLWVSLLALRARVVPCVRARLLACVLLSCLFSACRFAAALSRQQVDHSVRLCDAAAHLARRRLPAPSTRRTCPLPHHAARRADLPHAPHRRALRVGFRACRGPQCAARAAKHR